MKRFSCIALVVLVGACATAPARHLGSWEYRQGSAFVIIEFAGNEECSVIFGRNDRRLSARCKYKAEGLTVVITEAWNSAGEKRPDSQSFGGPFKFTLNPQDDTMTGSYGGPDRVTLKRTKSATP